MEVIISDGGEHEKKIDVKVPYDKLLPKINEAYDKYKKSIQLEGFRKGKVPLHLIKKVFGTKIELEVAENSMSDYLKQAIDENKVKFHDLQKIESMNFNKNDGLKFTALVRVEPNIQLKKYKGLTLEKEIYKVTNEDIELALESLRERHATMENVTGEAKEGNFIVADLQKTDHAGLPLIGEKFENRYFQLGGDNVDNRIMNQLIGVKPGDIRQIAIPADEGKGKGTEFYSVTVKEVKEKIIPALDDDFAKDIGEYENLASLKNKVRDSIEQQSQAADKQKFHYEVMDQLIKINSVELPDFIVDDFLKVLIENTKAEDRKNVDEKELKERYRADAVWNLKWRMIRDEISELENISVEEAEIDAQIENMSREAGTSAAKVRAFYKEELNRDKVSRELIDQKIVDFIAENSKVKEKTITLKDLKKKQSLIEQ